MRVNAKHNLRKRINMEPEPFPSQSSTNSFRLSIAGMHCAGCARRAERTLLASDDVISAQVNFASELASVVAKTSSKSLINRLESAGFSAQTAPSEVELRQQLRRRQRKRERQELCLVIAAMLVSLPLILPMLLEPFGIHVPLPGTSQFVLSLLVQVGVGQRFYRNAWAAVKNQSTNMDVLVSIGTTAAFGLSIYGLINDGPLYFESSAVLLTLVLLGKTIESRAKRQTVAALDSLHSLKPTSARLKVDQEWIMVPVDTVSKGRILIIQPGEQVPVDGHIIAGTSSIDESMLTGESLPIQKSKNDNVFGGTTNLSGLIQIEATNVGQASTLAKIMAAVEQAQSEKAKIEKEVNRISSVFVPAVLILASLTLAGWLLLGLPTEVASIRAVAVLVIACPCSLGLATPTALLAGTGAAARAGILIKNADVLSRAQQISTVVFDKTGTLTEGSPRISAIVPTNDFSESELLNLVTRAQIGNQHPLALASIQAWQQLKSPKNDALPNPPDTSEVVPGKGVISQWTTLDDNKFIVAVGSPTWITERGHSLNKYTPEIEFYQELGTVMIAEVNGQLAGFLAVEDPVRADAKAAIQTLQSVGLKCTMLTGDNQKTAEALAQVLGLSEVKSEVLPQDKANIIRRYQREGHRVAMVGDGINDAPALASADLGIAMGSGTDVAQQAADLTLMRSSLALVADAVDISRRTHSKICQNLFWAFAYNLIGLPLAITGYLSPMIAGAAMALSSVSVVGNALLLSRWSPKSLRSIEKVNS